MVSNIHEECDYEAHLLADQNRTLEAEVERLRAENELLETSRNSFREACHRYQNGPHLEIRMDSRDRLDEIVGSGGFHVEQMGRDHWFFNLGRCAFHLHGKGVRLVPLNHETWAEAKEALSIRESPRLPKGDRFHGTDDDFEHDDGCALYAADPTAGKSCDCGLAERLLPTKVTPPDTSGPS